MDVAPTYGIDLKRQRPKKAPLGRIDRLVVDNFKSYEGVQEIGPFDKFTCIIGPNGSGKSNIMDAISFCLGIRAKHLRGEKLKDLVYRREEEDPDEHTRSAAVTVIFRTASGQMLHFRREIDSRGTGRYLAGPAGRLKVMGYDEYLAKLSEQDVHVRARNFLVFQGDVMELARRQGTDLTGVLETISGSEQLKEQYEKLSKELELTQERSRLYFQHRREVEGSVALLQQQQAQAQRYQDLRRRRDELVVEAILFKLFCVDIETERCREDGQEIEGTLNRAEIDWRNIRKEIDDIEAKRKVAEEAANSATSQHFVLSSNVEQLKPEINSCKKQVAHWAGKLREKETVCFDEEKRRREWEATLLKVLEERVNAEMEIERLKSTDVPSIALTMNEAQHTEFANAAAQTDAENAQTRDRLREVEEHLRSISRDSQTGKRDLHELKEQRSIGDSRLTELLAEKAALEAECAAEALSLREKRLLADQAKQEVEKFALFKQSLQEEQRTLRFKLDAAKVRREKLEQLEVRQRIADELRDAFPKGVVGRLSELLLPRQKRFELALQMSLGTYVEAFVVTSSAVGRECVNYLKAKKISTETFLPLDRMVEPAVGPLHLLTQGSESRRLATLCAQTNETFLENHPQWRDKGNAHIETAIRFLLAGTIIVDDLEEAKTTYYQDSRKRNLMPRVVTLEGEVIAPNGNMMVNSVGQNNRVEFGGGEQLKEIRLQEQKMLHVEQDLDCLTTEIVRTRHRQTAADEEVITAEASHGSCEQRLRSLAEKLLAEQRLVKGKADRVEELRNKLKVSEDRMAETEKRRDSLQQELLRVGKRHFARLNRSLGVDDIREILQREQKERRALRDKIEEHEDLVRSCTSRERSLQERLSSASRLEALRRDCEGYRQDIDDAKKKIQDLEAKLVSYSNKCEESRVKMRDLIAAKETLAQEGATKRPENIRARARVEETRKRLKGHKERLKVLLAARCVIFRDCKERQLDIPMLSTAPGLEELLVRHRDFDDVPLEALEAASETTKVDFAALPEERRVIASSVLSSEQAKGVDADYEEQLKRIDNEVSEMNPNMHAAEQAQVEEGRLKEILQQESEANVESDRLSRAFEVVKAERISRFQDCFRHVESCVHRFYKALTSYDGYEGGSAYLDLDDAEEPYNGGIAFTACPPGKRFFPMELLSGGEKSMASMALLFAMHSYRPPPFMILDEVDAPFDRKNTNSLVSYLRTLDFQCLVISLKDSFFSHSDTIVGIYKDRDLQTSGSLVLPLKKLGEGSDDPESARIDMEDV